jgi:16S rRNA (guanine527-N7)-methyltransferase
VSEPFSVVSERASALARRFGLDAAGARRLADLVTALAAEPDPATSIVEPADALDLHVADSLVALELEPVRLAERVADIGSGVGFPGLTLAIALGEALVDLVESVARRAATVERLARAAGVWNAHAVVARAESWGAGPGRNAYDVVTARAVARLPVVVEYAAPLLRMGGALVVWRGRRDADEEAAGDRAAGRLGLEATEARHVRPFAAARDRHLHVFEKRGETPTGFPRRPGVAAKRPLT